MATRKSVSQQLSELREYTTRLEGELVSLRDIVKSYRTAKQVRKPFQSLSEWVPLFMQAHPTYKGSIPAAVLREFICNQGGIA